MGITLDTLDASLHSVKISDGTNDLLIDGSGHLSINDGGNSITIDNSVLTNLDATIDGSELQVDIVGALPAGDNNIGNVDIVTMPGSQIEDTASAGGETLLLAGGYRRDADTSPVSTDGDFHGLIFNNLGELKVSSKLDDVSNTAPVVTTVVVDTTVGGTQLVATAMAGRRDLTVQNLGSADIWIKDSTGVTSGATGNGFSLPKGSSLEKRWGDVIDLFAITAAGSSDVKVIEAA